MWCYNHYRFGLGIPFIGWGSLFLCCWFLLFKISSQQNMRYLFVLLLPFHHYKTGVIYLFFFYHFITKKLAVFIYITFTISLLQNRRNLFVLLFPFNHYKTRVIYLFSQMRMLKCCQHKSYQNWIKLQWDNLSTFITFLLLTTSSSQPHYFPSPYQVHYTTSQPHHLTDPHHPHCTTWSHPHHFLDPHHHHCSTSPHPHQDPVSHHHIHTIPLVLALSRPPVPHPTLPVLHPPCSVYFHPRLAVPTSSCASVL